MPGVGRGRPGFSRRGRAKPAARSDIPVGFLAAQVAPSAFTTRWPNTPGHSAPGVTGLCPPIAQELSPGSGLARASGARIGQPQPAAIAKTSVVTRKSPGSPKGPQGSSRVLKGPQGSSKPDDHVWHVSRRPAQTISSRPSQTATPKMSARASRGRRRAHWTPGFARKTVRRPARRAALPLLNPALRGDRKAIKEANLRRSMSLPASKQGPRTDERRAR